MLDTKIFSVLRIHPRSAVMGHDLFMTALAWALAYLVGYDFFTGTETWWSQLLHSLMYVIPLQAAILWWAGIYRGVWRFASLPDLRDIARGVAIGALVVALTLFLIDRMEGIPRSSLLLYPVFLFFLLGGPRLLYRMLKDHGIKLFTLKNRRRVLILGAGRSAELLVRDMLQEGEHLPIGILDDNPALCGLKIHGIPVLGGIDSLARIVQRHGAEMILIAIPSATGVQMRRIVELCEQCEIPFRTLPSLQDLISGRSHIKGLREVAIHDLLGRQPIALDWHRISTGLVGKVVLVTGAGGSIGSELSRQITRLGVETLVLFEQSEFNLYSIELELRREFPNLVLHACLGDIRDQIAVERVLANYRPEIIFHAAAYKHVPMLEEQAREAVRNNVLGTKTLALAAAKHGCATFVMISTDKAVNPISVMGMSKRIAEIFCQSLSQRTPTRFITVRFGNVLGSAGSVVALFQRQIAAGGPVTVTHPKITRFFMTIPEACQLIMQAATMGEGGEIYVLDMGEPVSITYLAEQMIKLAGKTPGQDIQIVYTGLRPGEKLFEELFHSQEELSHTGHEKILLARSREVSWLQLDKLLATMEQACAHYDEVSIRDLLRRALPDLSLSDAETSSNVVRLIGN